MQQTFSSPRRSRNAWWSAMITLLGFVLLVLAALFLFQRSLIYFPARLSRGAFQSAVEQLVGERVVSLEPFDAVVFEPPAGTAVAATAILFHGNAGLALDRAYLAPTFGARGIRLVLAEYPGYGARAGSPSEALLVEDARALYSRVAASYPGAPILLVGESLGTGVAVQVAVRVEHPRPARLVLLTPFLSLAATGARAYPYLPVRYLLRDRFDSGAALPRFKGPVAILIAGEDAVVGTEQGRELAQVARARGATVVVELPHAGHNSWSALITDADWTGLLGFPRANETP